MHQSRPDARIEESFVASMAAIARIATKSYDKVASERDQAYVAPIGICGTISPCVEGKGVAKMDGG